MAIGSGPTESPATTARGAPVAQGPQDTDARRHAGDVSTPRRSLRSRLTWTFALLVLTVALGQAMVVYWSGYHADEAMIDRILADQLERSVALYRTQPQFAFPNIGAMTLYIVESDQTAGLPAYLRALPAQTGRYELRPSPGVELHVAVRREGARAFYLAYDTAEHSQRQRDTAAMLTATLVAASLLGLFVARSLAGRLLRDLDGLAGALRSDDGRTQTFEPFAEHRETQALARALDEARARARQSLERERAFAAAANHELRTPLMQASSTLEVLESTGQAASQQALLGRLKAALVELNALTEALLRVARGRTSEASTSCALAGLVDAMRERTAADALARRIEVHADIPVDAVVEADAGSLTIVLLNLMRNAIRHSGGGRVEVRFEAGALLIDDDGEGLLPPPESGRQVRPPSASGQQGLGVGLAIVERICEANGWALAIGARPGGGTRARVLLTPCQPD